MLNRLLMSKPNRTVFKISGSEGARIVWSREHEAQLRKFVELYQGRNWKKIAEEMQRAFGCPELSAKKCRERWCNCANPDLDKTALTETEELFLLLYHHEYKNKWTLIAQHLPNRNSTKLKNNFSSFVRKICRRIIINDREGINSMIAYIQTLYATSLIHDMIVSSENYDKIVLLAPIHIYEHIKDKKITSEQCIGYIKGSTELILNKCKEHIKLRGLPTSKIEDVKIFLEKLMPAIKDKHTPNDVILDISLIEIIENCVEDLHYLKSAPRSKEEVKAGDAEREVLHVKELPAIHAGKDIGYVPYQQSLGYYESEVLHTPDISGISFPSLQSPLHFNNEVGIPIPTFASPAFQASLQSTQSNYGNPLLSPGYLPPIQMMKSPSEQFYMLPFQSQVPEIGLQYKASDFTAFTNKYL